MDQINAFLDIYGLLAIFVVLLLKSIGVPIPIPIDAILLAAMARTAQGRLVVWQTFAAILVALVLGGLGQFMLIRGPGRTLLYRYGHYVRMGPARLDAAASKVQHSGPIKIGLALLTPGLRSVTVTACGLAGLPIAVFAAGLALGNLLLLCAHFILWHVGSSLLSGGASPLALALLALSIGLVIGLVILRRSRRDFRSLIGSINF